MPGKARGLLQEDFRRMIRASKLEGLKNLVFHHGKTTIVMPLDDSYLEKFALGQPSAPDTKPEEEGVKLNW